MCAFVKYLLSYRKNSVIFKDILLNLLIRKYSKCNDLNHKRFISALFVSGDKATENYVPLVPYMDFRILEASKDELERNIKKRNLNINLSEIIHLYGKYKELKNKIEVINGKREKVAKQLRELYTVIPKENNEREKQEKIDQFKQDGKHYKFELKSLKADFYKIEDEFVHAFLNLPNSLHPKTPSEQNVYVFYTEGKQLYNSSGLGHLAYKQYIDFIDINRYYMKAAAAEFDVYCGYAVIRHFIQNGQFTQIANPDFVRAVLLQANATPPDCYHQVKEKQMQLQHQLNVAHLTGGASFESFLGAVTKLSIYPSVLPLKWISSGRLYEKFPNVDKDLPPQNLYNATQTNAVQLFSVVSNANEADDLMESFLNLCRDFYKLFNVHFRMIYMPSSKLTISESLRIQFEMYSPYEQRYICIGRLSNYTDFVSKRLLFTIRQGKDYQFPFIMGGPILYVSRLIAILLECDQSLENLNEKLLNLYITNNENLKQQVKKKGKSKINQLNVCGE